MTLQELINELEKKPEEELNKEVYFLIVNPETNILVAADWTDKYPKATLGTINFLKLLK
jgi:hypothetical protein